MNFIGIVSDSKCFENIKNKVKHKEIKLIHISKNCIGNIKNIKFEILIINDDLKKYEHELRTLEFICSNSKYILINTDLNTKLSLNIEKQSTIITYGLNQKATVTVSSITEGSVLIYLQRNIKNIKQNTIEVGEELIKIYENNNLKIYEILIIYMIYLLNDLPITVKMLEKSNFFEKN